MKLTIDPKALAEAVAWAARTIPQKPAVPVLSGILLEATGSDTLVLSVFDYDVSVRCEVAADVAEPGRVVLPGRVLAEVARALPGESFAELVASGQDVTITCGRASFVLLTLPEGDFPDLPKAPAPCGRILADVLREAVEQVATAAGKDDSLAMLTAIRVDVEADRLTLAATDRYRIHMRDTSWQMLDQAPAGVCVSARHLADLVKGGLTGPVDVGWTDSTAGFTCGGRTVVARLLDPQFINYRKQFASLAAPITVTVDTPALIAAIKRVALVAEKNTAVRLLIDADGMTVQAGGGEYGRGTETVPCYLEGADTARVSFLPPFLLDALAGIPQPQTVIRLEQGDGPRALFTGVDDDREDDSYQCLLMSLRELG